MGTVIECDGVVSVAGDVDATDGRAYVWMWRWGRIVLSGALYIQRGVSGRLRGRNRRRREG